MNMIDESDLIAYHLKEVSPRMERAIRRALEQNPELAAQSEAIAATLRMFDNTEEIPMVDAAVLDRNWNSIRPSLGSLQPRPHVQAWRWTLASVALLALLVAMATYVWQQNRDGAAMDLRVATVKPQQAAPSGTEFAIPSEPRSSDDRGKRKVPAGSQDARSAGPVSTPSLATVRQTGALLPIDRPLELALLQASPMVEPLLQQGVQPAPQTSAATPTSAAPVTKRKEHESDLSIGVFGDFIATRLTRSPQSAVPSAGALATFHQQRSPGFGYNISAGYTHTTFNYGSSDAFMGGTENALIGTNIFEISSAYVVQGPRSKRVSTFADAGGGMFAFLQTGTGPPESRYFRPVGVGGAGMNYRLNQHWALRAEYRGIYFKGPAFRNTGVQFAIATHYTLSSEPTVSLTYQFGKAAK